jgi:hypothetical protein
VVQNRGRIIAHKFYVVQGLPQAKTFDFFNISAKIDRFEKL